MVPYSLGGVTNVMAPYFLGFRVQGELPILWLHIRYGVGFRESYQYYGSMLLRV